METARTLTPIDDDRQQTPARTDSTSGSTSESSVPGRARDAVLTRQQLLEAARRRFAFDGYSATTVRDIASDVGVNVALINRYFDSKEGLFEACLAEVRGALENDRTTSSMEQIARKMISGMAISASGEPSPHLLLLLRSSGDARADEIRRNIVGSFAERLAATTGWRSVEQDGDEALLRAQIAIGSALGMALLRKSTRIEPLSSATEDELAEPMADLLGALLHR